MVTDKEGKPRGYAFVEYERERDMNGKNMPSEPIMIIRMLTTLT